MQIEVQHDEQAKKWFALVDGIESVMKYSEAGDRTLNFYSTFVPPELRGRGIADEIVQVALDDAVQKGYKVIPTCWFVRLYIDRHKDRYQTLLTG